MSQDEQLDTGVQHLHDLVREWRLRSYEDGVEKHPHYQECADELEEALNNVGA